MKHKHIGFGLFLLFVGIVWILASIGAVTWSILNALMVLWPLILIAAGVSIIFRKNRWVGFCAWLVFLAAVIGYSHIYDSHPAKSVKHGNQKAFSTELAPATRNANLRMSLGGLDFNIASGGSKLLEYDTSLDNLKYTADGAGSAAADLRISEEDPVRFSLGGRKNYLDLKLSDKVQWDLTVETGAVKSDMDLSKLDVRRLKLSMGAADMKIAFGSRNKAAMVKVESGASNLEMTVPSSLGIRIIMDGALNKTNLGDLGFDKKEDSYTSRNYSTAERKIDFNITMGVGKITFILK